MVVFVSNVFAVTVADAGGNKTFCVSEHFYINGSEPGLGEVAYWIDLDGLVMAPYDTLWGSQIEKAGSYPGVYRFKYVIKGGSEKTIDDLEVIIKDVPDVTGTTVTLADGCEGEEVTANVEPVQGADEYVWSITKGGTIYSSTNTNAIVTLTTDGSTSASVLVTAANMCGESLPVVATNSIYSKPREVPVIFGKAAVCDIDSSIYFNLVNLLDVDTWRWEWNGVYKGGSADSVLLNELDFKGLKSGIISLTPINNCGFGETASLNLDIIPAFRPEVMLKFSDPILDGKACLGDSIVVELDFEYSISQSISKYEYFINGESLGEPSKRYHVTFPHGSWADGDEFTVNMLVDSLICADEHVIGSAPIVINSKKEMLCGPLNLKERQKGNIVFYPNPASQSIQLSKEFEVSIIKIYNLEGKLELQESNLTEVNIEDLESGMHIIQVENESGVHSSKLIIE